MLGRIAAIVAILICTTVAWAILGSTIFVRTESSRSSLGGRVQSVWGAPQAQKPPSACWYEQVSRTVTTTENGRTTSSKKPEIITHPLPLASSRIEVNFQLDPRRKGLLWYATYKVGFTGAYVFRNTSDQPRQVSFSLPLPLVQAVYDGLEVSVDGRPATTANGEGGITATATVPPGQPATFRVAYRSQGLDSWRYTFGNQVSEVRDFELRARTDFEGFDFPDNTLAPSNERRAGPGWDLTWRYKSLLSGIAIGIEMPQKLQPGPVAGRISFFAPVSLLFFFFLMFIITALRRIELHPMNYFFLACAFFSFHLLLAYLADRMAIQAAFAICSAVSIFLVVSYLRLVVGMRFAAIEAGLSQLVYLVLFSYAFFLEGATGLTIAIGSIVTLFVVMQMTGRIRWSERFARTGQ